MIDMTRAKQTAARMPRAVVSRLIDQVAADHGVTQAEIMGSNRSSKVVTARYAAMFLIAATFPHLSYPRIGRLFGRDHSTVMHAFKSRGITKGKSIPGLAVVLRLPDGEVMSHELDPSTDFAKGLVQHVEDAIAAKDLGKSEAA